MATTVNHSGTAFLKPERSKFDGKGKFGSCLPACRGSIHCVHLVCLILFPVILRPDQFELYPSWKFDTMRRNERTNGRAEGLIGEYDPWSEIEHCCGWTVASELLRMARWFTEYDLLVKFMIVCRCCMMRGCMYILHEWVYGGTNHSISLAVPGWQTDNAAGEQGSRSTGRGA